MKGRPTRRKEDEKREDIRGAKMEEIAAGKGRVFGLKVLTDNGVLVRIVAAAGAGFAVLRCAVNTTCVLCKDSKDRSGGRNDWQPQLQAPAIRSASSFP